MKDFNVEKISLPCIGDEREGGGSGCTFIDHTNIEITKWHLSDANGSYRKVVIETPLFELEVYDPHAVNLMVSQYDRETCIDYANKLITTTAASIPNLFDMIAQRCYNSGVIDGKRTQQRIICDALGIR